MKTVVQTSAFQSYLAANLNTLRPSTTLFISSNAPLIGGHSSSKTPQKKDKACNQFISAVDTNVRRCQFFAKNQFNLKTVPFSSSLTSSYPTRDNVNSALDLMHRTGATNVIGVGNGAAMDLAKACFFSSRKELSEDSQLILVPGTLGATLASASHESIILCPEEVALLPLQSFRDKGTVDTSNFRRNTNEYSNVTVLVDPGSLAVPNWINYSDSLESTRNRANVATVTDAVFASLTISIDAAHALKDVFDKKVQDHYETLIHQCLDHAYTSLQCIIEGDSQTDAVTKSLDNSIQAVLSAGALISSGLDSTSKIRRNVPLALSSALLPRYFPHGNWMTFTASLLPGLLATLVKDADGKNDLLNHLVSKITSILEETENTLPSTAFFAEGSPNIDDMIDEVDANGAYLRCIDAKISVLESTLMLSLNR